MTKSKLKTLQKKRDRKKIYQKTHNIIHNNVTPKFRRRYFPITNRTSRLLLPMLLNQLHDLEKGIIRMAKPQKKKSWREKFKKEKKS